MKKVIFMDTETTGLDTDKCSPIQISVIIEEDGKIIDKWSSFVRPFIGASISMEALNIHGFSVAEINKFPDTQTVYMELVQFLNKHIGSKEKAILGGYNVGFDRDMLRTFFKKHNNHKFDNYFDWRHLDVLHIITPLQCLNILPELKNNKLETWCNHYGIDLSAHDSASDIEATRELFYKIGRTIKGD